MLGATDQRQPAGAGHLDHGGALRQPPLGRQRIAERSGDDRCAIRAAERFQDPVTAVGHRDLGAVEAQLPTGLTDGAGDFGSGDRALELVGGRDDLADAHVRRR